ncbi:MAG: hypothetical protein QM730_19830 [Anaerolineales bacterium]
MLDSNNLIPRLHYKVIYAKNTSPRLFRRLEGHIVLNIPEKITETQLLKIIKSAVAQLRRRLIRRKDIYGYIGLPGKPFSVTLRVYSAEKRLRRLLLHTWENKELVAIAEYSKNWNVFPPFYTKESNRILGQIRVKI